MGPNLALYRTATQSSTYARSFASLSVDGNTDNHFMHGSCSHTNAEVSPWWVVDLGMATRVLGVKITNRGDSSGKTRQYIAG